MSYLVNLGKARTWAALLATTYSWAAVEAKDADFLKCQTIDKDSERLACYDTAAQQITGTPRAIDATPDLTAAKKQLEEEIEQLKRQKNALDKAERTRKSPHDISYDGLSASITKIQMLHGGRMRLFLNNNQVWDQASAKRVFGFKEGAVIEFSEGALGSIVIRPQGRKRGDKFRRAK
jgi:hypothetical protein